MSNAKTPRLAEVAKEIASNAVSKRYPAMSIAAQVRRLAAPATSIAKVKELAEGYLAAFMAQHSPTREVDEERWLGLAEAARALQISAHRLHERLKQPRYRRLYGWPWHDGRQWQIAGKALAPDTRAAFLATLPSDEPHPDLLPKWCDRGAADQSR